ncbi:MAG: YcgL domain-containing protein [Pseudomonadota bacterium]
MTTPLPTTCAVYKGCKKPDAYLYVAAADRFEAVPAALLDQLGELEFVLELELTPGRQLARTSAAEVRQAITDKGYYLQPPPTATPLMPNDRLLR